MNFTAEKLTELAEQKPDEFIEAIYTICYEWRKDKSCIIYDTDGKPGHDLVNADGDRMDYEHWFNPLAKTPAGRSQSLELAEKFGLVVCFKNSIVFPPNKDEAIVGKTWQQAIGIASVLIAQENK